MSGKDSKALPVFRLIAQSLGILLSILTAFAIDAWWNDRQEHARYLEQIDTVAVELSAARRDLERNTIMLERLRAPLNSLLTLSGPNPEPTTLEDLVELLDLSFRHQTTELRSGAVQALISSGNIGEVRNPDLMALLAGWPAQISNLRNRTQLLESNRERLIEFLYPLLPTLDIAQNTGQMSAYPHSDFDTDTRVVLDNLEFEGRVANRAMMVEDALVVVGRLDADAQRMLDLIESERSGE